MSLTEGQLRHLAYVLAMFIGGLGISLLVLSIMFASNGQRGWSLILGLVAVMCGGFVVGEHLVERRHRREG